MGSCLTSDGQGVAPRGRRGAVSSVEGSAVILALLLLASLCLAPSGLRVVGESLVEGLALLPSVELVGDWARCFVHGALKLNGLPGLHLLAGQERELDLIHGRWKAGKRLAQGEKAGDREPVYGRCSQLFPPLWVFRG